MGFEPTGHYWFTLRDLLKNRGYRPENHSSAGEGWKIPRSIHTGGRLSGTEEAAIERKRLVDQTITVSCHVIRRLDIRFPESDEVFKDWSIGAAWLTLRSFPTPAKVMNTGVKNIVETWRKLLSWDEGKRRCYLHLYFDPGRMADNRKAFDQNRLLYQTELTEERKVLHHAEFYERCFTVNRTPQRGLKVKLD